MKKMRGFTLIECIIALAILGVASLIMAQIYANVSKINRANHQNNSSIAYQMKFAENKDSGESIKVNSGYTLPASPDASGEVPPVNNASVKNITLVKRNSSGDAVACYAYAVDYYVLQSRDQNNKSEYIKDASGNWIKNPDYNNIYEIPNSSETAENKNYILNYKYFSGYSN